MKMVETNNELELLLESIRRTYAKENFESDEDIDAYFKASILIFNNLKEPYWKGVKKGEIKYDDYFQSKMDLTFANDKQNAINQLFRLWIDKKTITIEYNLRGLEFIVREHSFEFDKNVIKMIVEVLNPLIKKAEHRQNSK
jgi:hypothetical protein